MWINHVSSFVFFSEKFMNVNKCSQLFWFNSNQKVDFIYHSQYLVLLFFYLSLSFLFLIYSLFSLSLFPHFYFFLSLSLCLWFTCLCVMLLLISVSGLFFWRLIKLSFIIRQQYIFIFSLLYVKIKLILSKDYYNGLFFLFDYLSLYTI